MSSPNLEGLEIKEATPSIAPSIYESLLYTRKWRVLLAVAIGASLLGVCVLGFYLGAESNSSGKGNFDFSNSSIPSLIEGAHWLWRSAEDDECLTLLDEQCPEGFGDGILLVVSLGGLRPDQVSEISAFVELKRCGVTSPNLVPSYPTLNSPNLYTIATGLYPEFHGIVSSKMYDPIKNISFEDSPSDRTWWGGEPIWNTVNKQGKRSAAYLWPGSDVRIQARYPSYWQKEMVEFRQRMSKVLEWIGLPREERPHLIMLHYNEPSITAQTHGIFSDQVGKILYEIGIGLDELMSSLHRMKIFNCVDLILLSDHGVAPFRCDDSIFVDDLLDNANVERIFTGPVGRLKFTENADREARNKVIAKLQCQSNKLRTLTKEQVPKRYHYTYSDRIGDLVLDTKVGSHVALEEQQECLAGEFGYNNIAPSMQGVFMAHGPSFKTGYAAESFRNIEIYNLMCLILGITPSLNNGTQGSLHHLLRDEPSRRILLNDMDDESHLYLREILRPRPNRVDNAVIGINGQVDEALQQRCRCDQTFEESDESSDAHSSASSESSEMTSERTTKAIISDSSTTPSITKINRQVASSGVSTESSSVLNPNDNIETVASFDSSNSTSKLGVESTSLDLANVSATEKEAPSSPDAESISRRIRSSASSVTFVKEDDSKIIGAIKTLHSPWGLPRFSAPEVSSDIVNILLQTNYISGFPESLNLAVWSSFTLNKSHLAKVKESKPPIPEGIKIDPQDIKEHIPVGCWIADPRLNRSKSDQCNRSLQRGLFGSKDFSLKQLYPEEFETSEELSSEGFLLSNLAPIKAGYERKGRKAMIKAIEKWVRLKHEVNVLHGPVFDYDHDGVRDEITRVRDTIKPLIPSDYFFVVTVCNSSLSLPSCPHLQLLSVAFVFPNTHREEGCHMTDEEYLHFHLCSMADVEKLTGLRLFRNIIPQEYARLKSAQHIQIFPFQ